MNILGTCSQAPRIRMKKGSRCGMHARADLGVWAALGTGMSAGYHRSRFDRAIIARNSGFIGRKEIDLWGLREAKWNA